MLTELTAEQIKLALQGISVPPQPQIMVDLQIEQYLPDPDLTEIARLISQDPGISGALLKLINSSYFGLSNRISSIQRAVNLLGSRSVINLINALSIKNEMNDDTIVTLNRFWDTAQDVAMTCLTLAKRIGSQAIDEVYALGLFHDCGVPLMFKKFPNYMAVLEQGYTSTHLPLRVVDAENKAFNTNHAVVGYFTAKAWCLPDHLSLTIANHHNALAVFSDDSNRHSTLKNLLSILKMAEHICESHLILGQSPHDHEWNSIGHLILDYIGLSEYDFQELKSNIRELGGR
ncbi:HDOD domain-containing protein [Pseudomonas gingeri]|uniref:HDOD domain-containing protein n=1 Tax=Pseudomonas gingeri TaxID=117681 RepID=A0A7Y7WN77_9PSED|nr:HDOD domain-containing protein [Pseudomonas gingeri]NWB84321.1 HDOD domain-containing protein [Pseudomonas gingeri]